MWLADVPVAVADDWTLRDAVAHALAHNLELRSTTLAAEQSDARLRGARAGFDPSVSASGDWTRYQDADGEASGDLAWSVGIAQPLPTGGTAALAWGRGRSWEGDPDTVGSLDVSGAITVEQPLLDGAWADAWHGVRSARFDAEAAALVRRSHAEALAVDVASAYWNLVSAREFSGFTGRSVEIAEEQLVQTRTRFEEGFAGTGDVLQVERALGTSAQARESALAAEAAAERRLARLIGLPQRSDPAITPVDRPAAIAAPPEAAEARTAAEAGNTSIRAAKLVMSAAELDRRHAVVGALPDLSVAGSIALESSSDPTLFDNPDRAWAVGATLSTPISPRGPLAAIADARLAHERAALAEEAAYENVLEDLDAALRAVARDRQRVALAADTLRAADQGLTADRELYAEGRGSTRDVVRSLEALEEAQLARLRADIDVQDSMLELARLEGRVFEYLGVEEPR